MFPVHGEIKMHFAVFVSKLTEQKLESVHVEDTMLLAAQPKKKFNSYSINFIPNSQGIHFIDHGGRGIAHSQFTEHIFF